MSSWQYSTVHNSACNVIEEQTLWALFEICLPAGMHQKTQSLRILMARLGYASVF